MRAARVTAMAALAAMLGFALAGCAAGPAPATSPAEPTTVATTAGTRSPAPRPEPRPSKDPAPRPATGTAASLLARLAVKGRGPMTGYDRRQFGQAWLDADRNGCDTRNDILGRDITAKVVRPGTRGCKVLSGVLRNPYTGRDVAFRQGEGDLVDIDHVVSLGNAWVTGAARWDIRKRAAFANDPLNLLAVDLSSNRRKGDSDAASWLPPARSYRCAYVARMITVKTKYRLAVTPPEKAALLRVLRRCPGQRAAPDPTRAPTMVDQVVTVPASTGSGSGGARRSFAGPGNGAVSYRNCDAVRAAGKAPLHRGDPGYSRRLDRDGDGTACE